MRDARADRTVPRCDRTAA